MEWSWGLIALGICTCIIYESEGSDAGRLEESDAEGWLAWYEPAYEQVLQEAVAAHWVLNTNITDHNRMIATEATVRKSQFRKEASKNASTLFDWQNFQNETLRRLFYKITTLGTSQLDQDDVALLDEMRSSMLNIYSTGKVCRPEDPEQCLNLDPELTRLMSDSRDYEELQWAWQAWRDATGKKMKDAYPAFIDIQNKAAHLNDAPDQGAYWRSWYEMDDFQGEVLRLWKQVEDLYKQLHAYVRRRLQQQYSNHTFPESGHIPAHILGNMWAQTWINISPLVLPFPNATAIDVTPRLVEKDYTVTQIIELADSFFTSLGLEPAPSSFWQKSMFIKPEDREVVCHASAWDFYSQQDFRIKQCTDITMEWLVTTHHEMGHVQYYLQYKHLPIAFRRGANPGFHEAVGDVMALSVATPEHLQEIGLLDEGNIDNYEADMNYLMVQALEKVAFLPFGFLIDQWRWDVFSGRTSPDQYNEQWWKYRCQYQGVSPPVSRSSEDFDPGAKFHIPGNTPYIRYFVSYILQFQIQKALCQESGSTRPLHRCDIYNSHAAGQKLANMLKLGSSRPWPEALQFVTGTQTMDASALMEYFQPLYDWLLEQNEGHNITWQDGCPSGSLVSESNVSSYPSLLIVYCSVLYWISVGYLY